MSQPGPETMADPHPSADEERKLESGTARAVQTSVAPAGPGLHPAYYIALWIAASASVVLFNKWVLATAKFDFPLFLTTWHMVFATTMTQLMARTTTLLDSRHRVPMTPNTYLKAIVPIGVLLSFSLICGNLAYLYLSVSFIQMLKATNAVATLLVTWAFGMAPVDLTTLRNVCIIVAGVAIASFGEIKFDWLGFFAQICGILFEGLRLVMVQRLLGSAEFKMDPLVSLYYFAPACAVISGVFTILIETPRLSLDNIIDLGFSVLFANALVAFMLNVALVLLIGKTSAVVLTMSGVLKDILLVAASMAMFRDPVTGQQFFGYSLALAGLLYYKLGAEKSQEMATNGRTRASELAKKYPRVALAALLGAALLVAYWVWDTVRPRRPEDYLRVHNWR